MTETCDFCGHSIDPNGDAANAKRFFSAMTGSDFSSVALRNEVESIVEKGNVSALLVAKKAGLDVGELTDGYYGEYPQGTTFEAYLVFRIGDSFFKKFEEGDSYGDVTWSNGLNNVRSVNPVTREVTDYK